MKNVTTGVTDTFGESQGYTPLPMRRDGELLISEWGLSRTECAAVVMGAPIRLSVIGSNPQPMRIEIGGVPPPAKHLEITAIRAAIAEYLLQRETVGDTVYIGPNGWTDFDGSINPTLLAEAIAGLLP